MGKNNKKKSQEQYIKEVENLNNGIKVIGKYVNSNTKILHECQCGHQWLAFPVNILRGFICPKCSYRTRNLWKRKTHQDYVNEVKKLNKGITVVEKYAGYHTKIKHKCINGHFWLVTPASILSSGYSCPFCSGLIKKTQEMYIKELHSIQPSLEVLGEYKNNHTKIIHKCKICLHEWEITPKDTLNSHGCPICKVSKGEKRIREWLLNNNIEFEPQMKYDDLLGLGGGNLSYDFYLPNLNLLIEYQGQFHDGTTSKQTKEEFLTQQEHDKRKRDYAKLHNINLLEIWYWDFNNVESILIKQIK